MSVPDSFISDASGKIGYGAHNGRRWFQGRWPVGWDGHSCLSIAFKEMYPIYIAFHLFGEEWSNHTVSLMSDNMAVVEIIRNMSSKDPNIMQLVRPIVLICMKRNILVVITHMVGVSNTIADRLSRYQDVSCIFSQAKEQPEDVSDFLLPENYAVVQKRR